MIVISGTPRCGSMYAQTYAFAGGAELVHEGVGITPETRGCIGYMFVDWPDQPSGFLGREGSLVPLYRVQERWLQTRAPLACIGSLPTTQKGAMWRIYTRLAIPACEPIVRAAYTWVDWNKLVWEQCHWQYRVEDLKPGTEVSRRFCATLGVEEEPTGVPATVNSKSHEPLTWRWLDAMIPGSLLKEVQYWARLYGYEV